jgi:hypothetical protein
MFVYGCVLNFIYLSARVMDEIAKNTHLKVCPHTFVCGHVVYLMDSIKKSIISQSEKVIPHLVMPLTLMFSERYCKCDTVCKAGVGKNVS